MCKREAELQAEVDGWLQAAEAADAAEDKAFGADRRGDEMPDWVADKQARLRPRFTKPRQNWRPKRKPRRRPSSPRVRKLTRSHRANLRRRQHQNRKRSATSPIPKAASSRPRTATSRATMHKPRSMLTRNRRAAEGRK